MQVRALHRLGEDELPALGDALAALVRAETGLVRDRAKLRRAAEQEARARQGRGVPGLGAYGEGYEAARQALLAITDATDSLFTQG